MFKQARQALCAASAGLALLLTACVPSVYPLYTPETIVFREDLVGIWKEKPDDEAFWKFSKAGTNSYICVIQEKEESSTLEARLVQLGESLYLDLQPSADSLKGLEEGPFYKAALVRGHLFMKIKLAGKLELQFVSAKALKALIEAEQEPLDWMGKDQTEMVLTATTERLQKFFKKHTAAPGLWEEPGILHKQLF